VKQKDDCMTTMTDWSLRDLRSEMVHFLSEHDVALWLWTSISWPQD